MLPKDQQVGDILNFGSRRLNGNNGSRNPSFDATIPQRVLGLHEILVSREKNDLLVDAQTALAGRESKQSQSRRSPSDLTTGAQRATSAARDCRNFSGVESGVGSMPASTNVR